MIYQASIPGPAGVYQSSKLFQGYSCVFRQWKAEGTHCRFLHGYAISFRVWFAGALDHRNWVFDFGGMRRAKGTINGLSPKDWFAYLLDHTVLIAQDDPELETFKALARAEVIQLRVLPQTGAECLAQYLYSHLDPFVQEETQGRVSVTQVEVYENHTNSGIYQA